MSDIAPENFRGSIEDDEPALTDEDIVREARTRFTRGMEYEKEARRLYALDTKWDAADAYNLYQWDAGIYTTRQGQQRPCLTINKTRVHNLQIINDAKQNKSAVKISPVGGGATEEAAEVFEGIIRHIEYISNASTAYDTATETQVRGGVGHWRIVTDYANDETFDLEIFIRRVRDPLSVLIDPDAQEADKSDARWGFVFKDMSRKQFKADYPEWADLAPVGPGVWGYNDRSGWNDQDHVRIAEYFRMGEAEDELIGYRDQNGDLQTQRASVLGKLAADFKKRPDTVTRKIKRPKVEWFKIVGNEIVKEEEWPGNTIPIATIIGEETLIDGTFDRKGHTRAMIDPQRSYNYHISAAVEATGTQTKSPWLVAAEAMEGNETAWANANTENPAYLAYKGFMDDGTTPIPKPERINPPQFAAAYANLMEIAARDIESVSGQHEAEMGKPSNEKSGIAIQQRQRQADKATYQYVDNLAIGIRRTGKDLLYLIPKIYDTKRTLRIIGEDGSEREIIVDPTAANAYEEHKHEETGEVVARIFNPTIGQYEVQADTGPNFATKREDAFNAFSQILQASPDLVHIAGDILFKNMDVPGAEELSERLLRMVPPQALGQAPPPAVQQMQQQIQELTQKLAAATVQEQGAKLESQKLRLALKGKDELRDIEVFDANTKRIVALKDALGTDMDALTALVHQAVAEALGSSIADVDLANRQTLAMQSEMPDASVSQPMPVIGQPVAQPPPNGQAALSQQQPPVQQ